METIIQFGEGGFLRSFVDKFIDIMNKQGTYDGKVVIVQPIKNGLCDVLNAQNCEYNLFLRGIKDGEVINERTLIQSVSRCINPYGGDDEYNEYLKLAHNKDIRFIVSNTTEAGIEFTGTDKFDDAPQASFPAKLTRL
ncbi:MAG: tagaturonate reductase, partial [Niameybacter sp.]